MADVSCRRVSLLRAACILSQHDNCTNCGNDRYLPDCFRDSTPDLSQRLSSKKIFHGLDILLHFRPALLYGSEEWCLEESELGILQMVERYMVGAICGIQLKDKKRLNDLMLILSL